MEKLEFVNIPYDFIQTFTFVKHIFGLVYYLSTARNSPFDVRCYTYGKRSFVLLMFTNRKIIVCKNTIRSYSKLLSSILLK